MPVWFVPLCCKAVPRSWRIPSQPFRYWSCCIWLFGKPFDLNSGCRILLTSHYLPEENDVFPAQLRAIVRPIHLLEIGLEYMTATKLRTLGFKEQGVLAKKLVGLVSSFVELFPAEAGSHGKLAKLMAICDQAAAAYREIESCSVSEELAVAGACYQYLQPMLSEAQGVPFSKLLQGHSALQIQMRI